MVHTSQVTTHAIAQTKKSQHTKICLFQHKNLFFLFYILSFQNTSYWIIYFILHFIKMSIFFNFLNCFSFFTHNNHHLLSSLITQTNMGHFQTKLRKFYIFFFYYTQTKMNNIFFFYYTQTDYTHGKNNSDSFTIKSLPIL